MNERALKLHKDLRGKLEVRSRVKVDSMEALSLAYTPGVADVCRTIEGKKELAYDYTNKWNYVAVVSDGTAVLGLGDIGPEAGLPVMEGKAVLFKEFANVDA
ncbi:MAG TPA: NAD-dependent malic enzyme, partial [Mesotoga sp.]|nr:NAD-dependent malic enzyme [Mesotoga prima]HRX66214.1 NAD-dependent malic enzyme [Mesotoga sp.]